jgi:hypothetical protein
MGWYRPGAIAFYICLFTRGAMANGQIVAVNGQAAPGLPGSTIGGFVIRSLLDDAGNVTFEGPIRPSGEFGLWSGKPGAAVYTAQTNATVPGAEQGPTTGTNFAERAGGDGRVAILTRDYVWAGTPGQMRIVAAAGTALPSPYGAPSYSTYDTLRYYVGGNFLLQAKLNLPGGADGVWLGASTGGPLQYVARAGDPVPGQPSGVHWLGAAGRGVAPDGTVVILGALQGPGTVAGNSSLWIGHPGALASIRSSGDPAPGMADAVFTNFQNAWLNSREDVLFYAVAKNASVATQFGLWRQSSAGDVSLVQLVGGPAPGMPGFTLGGLRPDRLTDRGESAIGATLSGPGVNSANDLSVWLSGPQGLRLLAREGDGITGAGNVLLKQIVSGPTIDAAGQVLFSAYLGGTGVDASNDAAVLGYSPEVGLRMLMREGGMFDLAPGDTRTLVSLEPEGTSSLNDLGQFAALVVLRDSAGNDSSAVIRVDGVVPEPNALCLLGLAAMAKRRGRRRSGSATSGSSSSAPAVSSNARSPQSCDGRSRSSAGR